jgi:hypothetical protein
MIYELFLEGQLADIRQDLGMQLNYNIDDINKYGSRDTSFSKTIVLPGTAKNNRLLGFVGELGSFNDYAPGAANINANFNPAQTTKAELRANGLLLLKGVFRLTGIVKDRDMVEYEGNLFGELGGFIAEIGRGKLEDLDFNEYNHNYTYDNIVRSWDGRVTRDVIVNFSPVNGSRIIIQSYTLDLKLKPNDQVKITNALEPANNKTYTVISYDPPVQSGMFGLFGFIRVQGSVEFTQNDAVTIEYPVEAGTGYYYPLIDYGTYSTQKVDYDYRTFRPALFVKEYIDKIFKGSGYTYESSFLNSAFFKKLIIPNNTKELKGLFSDLLDVKSNRINCDLNDRNNIQIINFDIENLKRSFTGNGNPNYTYTGFNSVITLNYKISGNVRYTLESPPEDFFFNIRLIKNSTIIKQYSFPRDRSAPFGDQPFNITDSINLELNTNDTFYFDVNYSITVIRTQGRSFVTFESLKAKSINPIVTDVIINDPFLIKYSIPRNIFQKDFFTWIVQMFNLYVTEDKVKEKHLLIEPYVDYYDLTESEDWTYKVARDKPWQIKPMGMLASRFYEYKYKDDTDFYNEGYKKKYNQPYGTSLQDTQFQFAKAKQTLDVGFSPSVLVEYLNRDKIVSALYKKSKGGSVDQEERMDTNIRIMMAKKITGVTSWRIVNTGASQNSTPVSIGANLTSYGYAGHFDDPKNPTKDINFAAADEIYCDPVTYPTNNLFNDYWSGYIAEIADKDSKLLTCYVYLTELDVAQLDFSKPVFIDGVLWRINKIMDFDASSGELTKVELLKVINNG